MQPNNTPPRPYSAAHFAIELDNKKDVGLFKSMEGGNLKVEPINSQNGSYSDTWKQLGRPKFEDIKLQVGMAMSQPFYDWVSGFCRGEVIRKNGALVAADFYYKERARREFTDAMITELTFPKLDGSDKNAVYLTATISPETITFVKGSGQTLQVPEKTNAEKLWTACNFGFVLDNFDDTVTKFTTKVDSFTIKQKVIEYYHGQSRHALKAAGRIEYPNINFYVPEAHAFPLLDHFHKRGAAKREGNAPNPLNGRIMTYDNAGTPLGAIHYYGADVIAANIDKSDAGSEEFKQVKFELSIERMMFLNPRMEVS